MHRFEARFRQCTSKAPIGKVAVGDQTKVFDPRIYAVAYEFTPIFSNPRLSSRKCHRLDAKVGKFGQEPSERAWGIIGYMIAVVPPVAARPPVDSGKIGYITAVVPPVAALPPTAFAPPLAVAPPVLLPPELPTPPVLLLPP